MRTICTIVCVAIVLALASFCVNVEEGALIDHIAPHTALELTVDATPVLTGGARRVATLTPDELQREGERLAIVQACSEPAGDQRICADEVTRVVLSRQQASPCPSRPDMSEPRCTGN